MAANINETGCHTECDVTFHYNPAHPDIATHGGPGDVRRCEHDAIWLWEEEFENRYFCHMDRWRRLHPWWNRRQYRRAVEALSVAALRDGGTE